MTKSVIIDGIEYVPKTEVVTKLAIVSVSVDFGEPDFYGVGTRKLAMHKRPPKCEMTIQNWLGEHTTVEIPESVILAIEELVR